MSTQFQSSDLPSQLLLLTTLKLLTTAPNQNFTHVRAGPVRVLSEVMEAYLCLLARHTREQAHSAGRSEGNLGDAASALHALGLTHQEMLSWSTDPSAASEPDEGTRDLAALAALLEPSKAKRPDRRKRLEYRQISEEEQQSIAMRLARLLQEDEGDDESQAADLRLLQPSLDTPTPKVESTGWRSLQDIPTHIPHFLPPLPGLERPFMPLPPQPTVLARPLPAEMLKQGEAAAAAQQAPEHEEAPRLNSGAARTMTLNAGADLAALHTKHGHVDPWKHVIPFDRSHLLAREPDLHPANVPLPLKLDDGVQPPDPSSLRSYFLLHKHLAGQSAQELAPTWPKSSKRRQAAALLMRPDAASSDRLEPSSGTIIGGGTVGAQRPRFTRKVPGWLPYPLHRAINPRDKKAQPNPILHSYDLQSDVLDNISDSLVPSTSKHDLSASLAGIVGRSSARRAAGQDLGLPPGVKGFLRRTTRIAQPGPLGGNGETLPFAISTPAPTDADQTKRLLYGFEWKHPDHTASIQPPSTTPAGTPLPPSEGEKSAAPLQSSLQTNGDATEPPQASSSMQQNGSTEQSRGSNAQEASGTAAPADQPAPQQETQEPDSQPDTDMHSASPAKAASAATSGWAAEPRKPLAEQLHSAQVPSALATNATNATSSQLTPTSAPPAEQPVNGHAEQDRAAAGLASAQSSGEVRAQAGESGHNGDFSRSEAQDVDMPPVEAPIGAEREQPAERPVQQAEEVQPFTSAASASEAPTLQTPDAEPARPQEAISPAEPDLSPGAAAVAAPPQAVSALPALPNHGLHDDSAAAAARGEHEQVLTPAPASASSKSLITSPENKYQAVAQAWRSQGSTSLTAPAADSQAAFKSDKP